MVWALFGGSEERSFAIELVDLILGVGLLDTFSRVQGFRDRCIAAG